MRAVKQSPFLPTVPAKLVPVPVHGVLCLVACAMQEAADYAIVQMVRLSIKTGGSGQVGGQCNGASKRPASHLRQSMWQNTLKTAYMDTA